MEDGRDKMNKGLGAMEPGLSAENAAQGDVLRPEFIAESPWSLLVLRPIPNFQESKGGADQETICLI